MELEVISEFESHLDNSHYIALGKLFLCLPQKLSQGLNQGIDISCICLPCLFLPYATYWWQPLFPLRNSYFILPNSPQGWAFGQRKSKQNFINGNLFFNTAKTLFQCLLASIVTAEKSSISLIIALLKVMFPFPLAAFKMFSFKMFLWPLDFRSFSTMCLDFNKYICNYYLYLGFIEFLKSIVSCLSHFWKILLKSASLRSEWSLPPPLLGIQLHEY